MRDFRSRAEPVRRYIEAAPDAAEAALASVCAPDCVWRIAHPVNQCDGASAVVADWLSPLRRAFPQLSRRDLIVIGGESSTGSGRWIATLGHYAGDFVAPLLGVPASGQLAFLRIGEFYRLDDAGMIAEAVILPDLLDLMWQAGRCPMPAFLGSEIAFPSPQTHDGVLPGPAHNGAASLAVVEAMLRDLRAYDPTTFESAGQFGDNGYWREDMMWYGPGGVGSNTGYLGFQRDHRIPFLTAFPDRVGGNHFARFGDGAYVASGGWPSMTMTWAGPYLGQPPDGEGHSLRVMDFWRVDATGKIAENWVLLDIVELFHQVGRDLIAEAQATQPRPTF